MPMYEYACGSCGHSDTLLERISASRRKKCPACGKARAFERQLSAAAFHLKGSGWYVTDFRDKGKNGEGDKADADAKDGKADKPEAKEKPAKAEAKAASAEKPEKSKAAAATD